MSITNLMRLLLVFVLHHTAQCNMAARIVSLHLPLNEATRGLIGEAELAKMREGAFLVNTSRGELLDEAALRRALVSGKLGGGRTRRAAQRAPGRQSLHGLA